MSNPSNGDGSCVVANTDNSSGNMIQWVRLTGFGTFIQQRIILPSVGRYVLKFMARAAVGMYPGRLLVGYGSCFGNCSSYIAGQDRSISQCSSPPSESNYYVASICESISSSSGVGHDTVVAPCRFPSYGTYTQRTCIPGYMYSVGNDTDIR